MNIGSNVNHSPFHWSVEGISDGNGGGVVDTNVKSTKFGYGRCDGVLHTKLTESKPNLKKV